MTRVVLLSFALGAVSVSGCVAASDNPSFTDCASDGDCPSGARCVRGFCVAVDAGTSPDAPGLDVPREDVPGADAPDASCPGAGSECTVSGMAGVCAAGTVVCQTDGSGRCVRANEPSPEQCNDDDDDCDGAVDEQADEECFTGVMGCARTAGVWSCTGVCRTGIQRCGPSGDLGVCEGDVTPTSSDDCSAPGAVAVDDDCDGAVDEDCACVDGTVRDCYAGLPGTAGVGRCMAGTMTCAGGTFGACSGEVLPIAETCDAASAGIDDDCNGTVDDVPGTGEPCDTGMMGVCADGVTTCVGGAIACAGPTARAERCDGTDDDCDGIVDDGFDLDTSEDHCGVCGRSCGAGRTCCGGECVSTSSDPLHCGDCPTTCSGATGACCDGVCAGPTSPQCTDCDIDCSTVGQTCCNGSCVDFMSDPASCGGCGPSFACETGERCCGGTCVGDSDLHCGSCDACDGAEQCCAVAGAATCVPDDDPTNCRACGAVCGSGQTCCDAGCATLASDPRNCGACGRACSMGQMCSSGLCCPMGQYNSDGICCPTGSYNSGGICCMTGFYNSGGMCCRNGLTNCGGSCVDTNRDETHCGACLGAGGSSCGGLSPRCCGGSCGALRRLR